MSHCLQCGFLRKGPVAEWLGRALQKLVQRFESARDLQKNLKAWEPSFAFSVLKIIMRYSNYIGIAAGLLMLAAAYFPWIYIPSIGAEITGMGAGVKTVFGKPALMNHYLMVVITLFFLIPKTWAKRMNTFAGAINFAWAFRNLLLLSTCRNGECPEKQVWLYVYFVAAFVVLVMTVLPDLKVKKG